MGGGRSTFVTFLLIIAGIFGVLLVLRLIGGLFNRSAGQGSPGRWHGHARSGNGRRAGLLRWRRLRRPGRRVLFERARRARRRPRRQLAVRPVLGGRHGQYGSADAGYAPDSTGTPDQGGDAIIGADDDPGRRRLVGEAAAAMPAAATGAVAVATGAAAVATGAAVAATGE